MRVYDGFEDVQASGEVRYVDAGYIDEGLRPRKRPELRRRETVELRLSVPPGAAEKILWAAEHSVLQLVCPEPGDRITEAAPDGTCRDRVVGGE